MDYIIVILGDYLKWEKLKQRVGYDDEEFLQKDRDNLRLKYDDDAKYYYEEVGLDKEEALKADTIVSFFTPYKGLLELEANWKTSKSIGYLEALIKRIIDGPDEKKYDQKTIEKINKILSVNNNEIIKDFAEVCYTKGNYMLLPARKMNIERYNISQDRIDLALYECFSGGKLAHFFDNDDKLRKWIIREKLNGLFYGNELNRENIKWLVPEKGKHKLIAEIDPKKERNENETMDADEIYTYLKNATAFIKERTKRLEESFDC